MHRVVWRTTSIMKTTCIKKQRYKNGKIVKYIIKDLKSGQYFEFTPAELKSVISSGNMECDNLTLTKDNRLMDKKKVSQCKAEDAMWDTLSKIGITDMSIANLRKYLQNRLGLPIKHLQTKMDGEYCCVGHLPMYIEILNDQYNGVYFESPLPVVEISNKYLEGFIYNAKSCNLTVYGEDLEQIDKVLAIYKQYTLGNKVIAGFDEIMSIASKAGKYISNNYVLDMSCSIENCDGQLACKVVVGLEEDFPTYLIIKSHTWGYEMDVHYKPFKGNGEIRETVKIEKKADRNSIEDQKDIYRKMVSMLEKVVEQWG